MLSPFPDHILLNIFLNFKKTKTKKPHTITEKNSTQPTKQAYWYDTESNIQHLLAILSLGSVLIIFLHSRNLCQVSTITSILNENKWIILLLGKRGLFKTIIHLKIKFDLKQNKTANHETAKHYSTDMKKQHYLNSHWFLCCLCISSFWIFFFPSLFPFRCIFFPDFSFCSAVLSPALFFSSLVAKHFAFHCLHNEWDCHESKCLKPRA